MASVDTPEENKGFAEKEQADFPILSDPTKQTATAYGVIPEGKQMAARHTIYIGPDGKILFIDQAPGTAKAGETVAARLEELGVRKR